MAKSTPLSTDYRKGQKVTVVDDIRPWVAYIVKKNPNNSAEYIVEGSDGWKFGKKFAVHWCYLRSE